MKLYLKKPLAFFDLETTGVNVSSDRIVEIAVLKVLPDGTEEVMVKRVNPGIPIPAESSLFHGIYDEDIKDHPSFKEVGKEIADFIGDSDLAGYNSNKFDVPMLMEEFLRNGIDFSLEDRKFVDVQNIFHQMEQRTLKAAYKFYCNENLDNAHSAEADVRATFEVLKAQLEKYEGAEFEDKYGNISVPVKNNVEELHKFTNLHNPVDFAGRIVKDDDDVVIFNFGKHKGKSVVEVFESEPSYYAWMQNGDFPLYTKKVLGQLWNEFKNSKKENKAAQFQSSVTSAPENIKGENSKKPLKQKKSQPISDDMLKQLQGKFGKL